MQDDQDVFIQPVLRFVSGVAREQPCIVFGQGQCVACSVGHPKRWVVRDWVGTPTQCQVV